MMLILMPMLYFLTPPAACRFDYFSFIFADTPRHYGHAIDTRFAMIHIPALRQLISMSYFRHTRCRLIRLIRYDAAIRASGAIRREDGAIRYQRSGFSFIVAVTPPHTLLFITHMFSTLAVTPEEIEAVYTF